MGQRRKRLQWSRNKKKVGVGEEESAWQWGWGGFLEEVWWRSAMQTLEGEQGDFVGESSRNRKPVKWSEHGGDVLMFHHSHQDPGSTALNILKFLYVLAWNPDENVLQESSLEETKARRSTHHLWARSRLFQCCELSGGQIEIHPEWTETTFPDLCMEGNIGNWPVICQALGVQVVFFKEVFDYGWF